jgi:hypothetical protein
MKKMTDPLAAAAQIITRWIASCLNDNQLDACANAIENCIQMESVWEDSSEVIQEIILDMKEKLDHKRHTLNSFPGTSIGLPGKNYEETEK